jgi:hypothetical protein
MILLCFQRSISDYIQQKAHGYIYINNKVEKTQFVNDTVHELRRQGYRFLTKDDSNRWLDIGDAQTIDKVGHSLRVQVAAIRKAAVAHVGCGVVGVAQESSSASETDENRTTLGQRTMTAAGAYVALQERAMAGTDVYDNLFTTTTESTTTATTSTTAAATATTTNTTSAAARPSAAKKPRLSSDDKVRLFALRTRPTLVMADLQHDWQENGRLRDENAHWRQAAEHSRVECFTLRTQVSNLSAVVREVWSRQDGICDSSRPMRCKSWRNW